jgi:hypothetical protein
MLSAMSHKPMIRRPAMIIWSVWVPASGPEPAHERLGPGGQEHRVDLQAQGRAEASTQHKEQREEALPAGQLGLDHGGRARRDQEQLRGQQAGVPCSRPQRHRCSCPLLVGTVRIHVTSERGAGTVFAGVSPAAAAGRYLAGVGYDTVRGITRDHPTYTGHHGGAPATAPARAGIWAAEAAGPGTQTLTWPDRGGSWTVVAMNADGSQPVAVRISVAAALPSLPWIAAGLLAGGIFVLAAGVILIAVPARHAASHR